MNHITMSSQDIVNVLLFEGKRVVLESDLVDAQSISQYKAFDALHAQERDVSKLSQKYGKIHISFFGFENQTDSDSSMPLRVISYDGASYRAQMLSGANDKKDKGQKRYPVITLVLYFGTERRWTSYKSLKECLEIPAGLEKYVSDYKINVFEIAYLPDSAIDMFTSDFRLVAEYLKFIRLKEEGSWSRQEVKHINEVLDMFQAFSGRDEYIEIKRESNPIVKGRKVDMFDIFQKYIDQGMQKGIQKGRQEGRQEGTFSIAKTMLSRKLDVNLIAECTGLSVAQVNALKN